MTRHVIILNPAHSVRAERYQVLEGKTPEITVKQARKLLASIDLSTVVGLRDRAAIAVLIYTAARVGAVAMLQRRHFYYGGEQWNLHFDDKGGKSREIPIRHDLGAVPVGLPGCGRSQRCSQEEPPIPDTCATPKALDGKPAADP